MNFIVFPQSYLEILTSMSLIRATNKGLDFYFYFQFFNLFIFLFIRVSV